MSMPARAAYIAFCPGGALSILERGRDPKCPWPERPVTFQPTQLRAVVVGDGEVIVRDGVSIEQVVHKRLNGPLAERHASPQGHKVRRWQREECGIELCRVRVLLWRLPLALTLVLPVHTYERLLLEQRELVLQSDRESLRRIRLAAFADDGIPVRHDRRRGLPRKLRIPRVARLRVTGSQLSRQRARELELRLNIAALGRRLTQVGNEGDLTDRRHDSLLDVVPLDEIHA